MTRRTRLTKSLYISLVRPLIEYCNIIHSPPRLKRDQVALENVLRRATKLVPELRTLSYADRLHSINLPSTRYRLLRGKMIECYKIMHSQYRIDRHDFSEIDETPITRGHNFKIKKTHCRLDIRK